MDVSPKVKKTKPMKEEEKEADAVPAVSAEELSRPKRKADLFLDDSDKFMFDFAGGDEMEGGNTGEEADPTALLSPEAQTSKFLEGVKQATKLEKDEELQLNTQLVHEASRRRRAEKVELTAGELEARAQVHLEEGLQKLFTFDNVWTPHARLRMRAARQSNLPTHSQSNTSASHHNTTTNNTNNNSNNIDTSVTTGGKETNPTTTSSKAGKKKDDSAPAASDNNKETKVPTLTLKFASECFSEGLKQFDESLWRKYKTAREEKKKEMANRRKRQREA